MADMKTSQLAELEQVTGQEMIPVQNGPGNNKVSVNTLKQYIVSSVDLEEYITKEEAQKQFQPKGNYATNETLLQKQDKTDESLQTTDKTVAGAINEVKATTDTLGETLDGLEETLNGVEEALKSINNERI